MFYTSLASVSSAHGRVKTPAASDQPFWEGVFLDGERAIMHDQAIVTLSRGRLTLTRRAGMCYIDLRALHRANFTC